MSLRISGRLRQALLREAVRQSGIVDPIVARVEPVSQEPRLAALLVAGRPSTERDSEVMASVGRCLFFAVIHMDASYLRIEAGAYDRNGSICTSFAPGIQFIELHGLGGMVGLTGAFGYANHGVRRIRAHFADRRSRTGDSADGVFMTVRGDDVALSRLDVLDDGLGIVGSVSFEQRSPPSSAGGPRPRQ